MNRPWMLVMIAASALPGCTLFSKKDKVDQRTHVPGEAAKPENPPAADNNASTSAVTPMNGQKSPRTKAHPRRRQLPMSSA